MHHSDYCLDLFVCLVIGELDYLVRKKYQSCCKLILFLKPIKISQHKISVKPTIRYCTG